MYVHTYIHYAHLQDHRLQHPDHGICCSLCSLDSGQRDRRSLLPPHRPVQLCHSGWGSLAPLGLPQPYHVILRYRHPASPACTVSVSVALHDQMAPSSGPPHLWRRSYSTYGVPVLEAPVSRVGSPIPSPSSSTTPQASSEEERASQAGGPIAENDAPVMVTSTAEQSRGSRRIPPNLLA